MNKPLSIVITVTIPLLVVACHCLTLLNRPSHLNQVVAELGSIGRFENEPVPNHADTRLLFIETTEHGYGFFLSEIASNKRTLLFEQIEKGPTFESVHGHFLGWAPDDSCFAYVRRNNGWQIVICNGLTGATQAVLPSDNYISSTTWFTPQSLVLADTAQILYSMRQFKGQWLHPVRFKYFRDPSHQRGDEPIEQLTARDDGSVVWRQGNTLLKCGGDSDAPGDVLGKTTTATMDAGIGNTDSTWYEMGYNAAAPETGLPVHGSTFISQTSPDHSYAMAPDYTANNAVLIGSDVRNGTFTLNTPDTFSRLSFLTAAGNGATTISYVVHHANSTVDSGTFVAPDWFSGVDAVFVANGRYNYLHGCEAVHSGFPKLFAADVVVSNSASPVTGIDFAYTSGSGHAAIFAVSGATMGTFNPIPVAGYNVDIIREVASIDTLAKAEDDYLDQNQNTARKRPRFVIESLYDQPPGIWEHDPDSPVPRCVVPNVDKPFHYVENAPIEQGIITNAVGDKLTYYLLSPVNNATTATHPLVLAILGINEMGFTWSHNHEAFANCGAYFVSVDRQGRDYDQWGDDALTVYEALAGRLAINTNRVYLYADSAGVGSVYSLLYENPDLWQGAIIFSPVGFPDPSKIQNKRLFFDCGGDDGDLAERAISFRDEAARMGTPVTLLTHPGLKHYFRIPQLERERMREALILFGTR